MGWQCAVQVIGGRRGDAKPNSKTGKESRHRGNLEKLLKEMAEERQSKSPTLDRTRSGENIYYQDEHSGEAVYQEMKARADAYTETHDVPGKMTKKGYKKGYSYTRKLRDDALIGVCVNIHPPCKVTKDWTQEKLNRFYKDAFEVLAEIEPDLFRPENGRFGAEHKDEAGPHIHACFEAISRDGRYCGSKVESRRFYDKLNTEFPKLMRKRKWDIDDMDLTDWDRVDPINHPETYDEVYAGERWAHRKKSGMSVQQFSENQAVENLEQTEETLAEAKKSLTTAKETSDNMIAQASVESDRMFLQGVQERQEQRDKGKEEAGQIVSDAETKASKIINEANAKAGQIVSNAEEQAGQITADARAENKTLQEQNKTLSGDIDRKKRFEASLDEIEAKSDEINKQDETDKKKRGAKADASLPVGPA